MSSSEPGHGSHPGPETAGSVRVDWPLIGRAAELDRLRTVVAERQRHAVVIAGEGGVGKTRLATECLSLGAAAGYATARITATRAAAGLPLAALTPLLPRFGDGDAGMLAQAREALLRISGDGRLMLMVDDAHLLDDASAALLHQVVQAGQLLAVLTVRTGEPVSDAVVALWKDGHAVSIEVAPLPDFDIAALTAAALGGEVDPSALARLCRATGGNPLALREFLIGAEQGGDLHRRDGRWFLAPDTRTPPRLRELVAGRLAGLTPDQREALELVALGEPLGLRTFGKLGDPRALELLESRGLVEVRPDRRRLLLWLAHPLYGEVLRDELPTLRRRRLVRALVDAVNATGRRRDDDESRVALWSLELGDYGDPALLIRAARRALAATDIETSHRLAAAAWRGRQDAAAGHLLGMLLSNKGDWHEADAVLGRAAELTTMDRERTRVATARAENLFRGLARAEDGERVYAEAELQVSDPTCRAELVAHRAHLVLYDGRSREALDLVEPLLTGDDPRSFVYAAFVGAVAKVYDGRPADGLELAARARQVHAEVWERELLQWSPAVHGFSAILGMMHLGQLEKADGLARFAWDNLEATPMWDTEAVIALFRGMIALYRGRMATAQEWSARAAAVYAAKGMPARQRWALAVFMMAALQRNDIPAARDALRQIDAEGPPLIGFAREAEATARAWLLFHDGHLDEAHAMLLAAASQRTESRVRTSAAFLLFQLARLGRAELAVEAAAALAPQLQGEFLGAALDFVAASARSDGERLEQVAAVFERIGARLYAAEAWATAHRAHAAAGRPRRAEAAFARVAPLVADCEDASTPALGVEAGATLLTSRERDVALLAARGMPSKEIAERLALSIRTVDNHLHRCYLKLGVNSRQQLAEVLGLPHAD